MITNITLNLGKIIFILLAITLGVEGLVDWWIVLLVVFSTLDFSIKFDL